MKSSIELPPGFFWDHTLQQGVETARLNSRVWPNYLIEDSDIPEPGFTFEIDQQEFSRRFPSWGIRRSENKELVAFINAVLLSIDNSSKVLPNDGWSYAIRAAGLKEEPNCLCLLVANVSPDARGFGFSGILIERAKQAARALSFGTMIAPVRPTLKHEFPLMPMNEYLAKKNDHGEIYDPWIRMHVKAGGKVENVCSESVKITASLPKWRTWTGLSLDRSEETILPGGLAPLVVDLKNNIGVYREPNVWLRYDLQH